MALPTAVPWANPMTTPTFRDLQDRVHETQREGEERYYIYRGQASGWSLTTSLERACDEFGIELTKAGGLEQQLLREFKRRAHHYLDHVPDDNNIIEWLALMQHHGAPTRLLDWTYSLPVAAYFALLSAFPARYSKSSERKLGRDAEVWMINTKWCRDASIRRLPEDDWVLTRELESTAEEERLYKFLFPEKRISYVYSVNPFRLNERLTIQRGVFLFPGDPGRPFEDNLRALGSHENPGNVNRFRIPRESMVDVLKELQESNISEATLFPGLDGFARSLLRRLPFFLGQQRL
jgi:hypothetical protein